MLRRQRPLLAAGIVLVAIALLAWRFDLMGIRSGTPLSSVAAAFEPPLPYPGYTWSRNGQAVDGRELTTAAGPDHCGWRSATFLTIGWPSGTVSKTSAEARQYIRDPHGDVRTDLRDRFRANTPLPSDARPTGHRHGSLEIYVSPSDQDDAIYIVGPGGAERWPRADPMAMCE